MRHQRITRQSSRRSSLVSRVIPFCLELCTRIILFLIFWCTEGEWGKPSTRNIRPEEIWLYKYPRRVSYVPTWVLWTEVLAVGPFILVIVYLLTRDRSDLREAFMSYSLACLINGAVVNVIKLAAGRPRPDFYYRCFIHEEQVEWSDDVQCSGLAADIIEGRKSFPSGHSSWSFTVLVWVFFYISGKLETFSLNGDRQGWKLVTSIIPIILATCVAISRTVDNHHHWQDVLVGSLLGMVIAYTVYRRYYPSLSHRHCRMSLHELTRSHSLIAAQQYADSDEDVKVV
ncbi:phospholipid phosphatase 5-like [Watersipora subatra]|uniref:phospholipid phosphatase 5-like n=1 Tax=Watersipora subatra TaxID=2589382 RepID=UPI00355B7DAC